MHTMHVHRGGHTALADFSGKREHQLTLCFKPEAKGTMVVQTHWKGLLLLCAESWRVAAPQEWQAGVVFVSNI